MLCKQWRHARPVHSSYVGSLMVIDEVLQLSVTQRFQKKKEEEEKIMKKIRNS